MLGLINIGDFSVIGAYAVCLRICPPPSQAVCEGVPARNIAEYE